MAGDWIKMRIDLQSHPKVVRILSATRTDKFRVIGGLHSVWSVFDLHSEDGRLRGYTPEALDHVIGWDGFSRAMESVGWLLFDGLETLTLPEFAEHNGQSAKRRGEDQKRKKNARKSPQSVRNVSADEEDKLQTREEKRREEEKTLSAGAAKEILAAYHGQCPMMPAVRVMTDARKRKLKARWTEDDSRQTVEYWQRFFGYVAKSDFLTGRDGRWTGCDFEWLIEAGNHVKVIEGKYENREAQA